MRTMRKLLASFVILCCALAIAPAQHAASPIYYHWVGRNTVYLWRSENDAKPVRALEMKGVWTFDPANAKTDPTWLAIVESKFPNPPAGSDSWKEFFNHLRDRYPNDDWAKIRKPDLQIYLRTNNPSRVLVTYVKGDVDTTVALVKNRQGWSAEQQDVLVKLAREHPAETKAVLETKDSLEPEAKLLGAWGAWMDRVGIQPGPVEKLLPVQTENGQARAVWLERLSESDWYRRVNLLSPAGTPTPSPTVINDPNRGNVPPPSPRFYRELWFQLLVVTAVVILLLVAWKLGWFKRRERFARGRSTSLSIKEMRRQIRAKGGRFADTGEDDEGVAEFVSAFEKSLRRFLSQVSAQSEKEKTQLLRESGMNGRDPGETRDLIETGEVARKCFSSLVKMQTQHGGGRDTLFPMQRNKQQWLTELPALIQSTTLELREKTEQTNRLGDDVDRQKERIIHLAYELSEAEKERTQLIRSQEELQRKLDEATQKGEDSQSVVNAVERVSAVANNFQQGLRYYLDQKKDTGTTAVIMALINYSLSKLCQGYAEQQQVLVNAMLVNLYTISEQLKDVHGFQAAVQEMEKSNTDIRSLRQSLLTTDNSHADDKMFQVLLKHLRELEKIDLAPFYFAIDQEKKVHYAN
jgi:hypothetical protein